ncbi:MAG: RNA polymerase sigma factor [Patiriisocius sp.]|uniref:RNA polymerase sigma factor n=1 Tax=Patiriisocius sp. TaxID=2822396 RepID=UPI003EF794AF
MEKKNSICDEKTYEAVYKEHSQSLRNFMFFKTKDTASSYDLVQEAFIKLWDNCGKVTPEKAKSFLFTVANNLFLNTVAHKKVRYTYANSVTESSDKQTPEFLLEEKQFGKKLQNALDNLTEIQRTAFLMSRVEGKKYREIAEILDISPKAAGKRVLDALENLRNTIENI